MDPSLDLSKLTEADKADLQQQLANEQQKATIQQSKYQATPGKHEHFISSRATPS
jgi:hypothetical protein